MGHVKDLSNCSYVTMRKAGGIKGKPKPSMQHSAPSFSSNSQKTWTNQQHLHLNCLHSNNIYRTIIKTLYIPAVSQVFHRKISKIDTNKSSGSSELVHRTSGGSMCWLFRAYTSSVCVCVWVDKCFMPEKLRSFKHESSAAQFSGPEWGKDVRHRCGHSGCVSVIFWEVMGRGQVKTAAVNILHHR